MFFCCLRDEDYGELGYTDSCGMGNVLLTWILSWAERDERMDLEDETAGAIVLS